MSQRTALFVATALTVFVMIMVVGVIWQVFEKSTHDVLGLQTNAPSQTTQVSAASRNNGPITQEQIAQREATFQEVIQQDELAKQLQVLQQKQADERARASEQAKPKVSRDQAVSVALATVPGAVLVRAPELVDFKGTAAYEVTLDLGVVYIDANTGTVLYNSAAVVVIRSGGNNTGGGGGNPNVNRPNNQQHKDDDKDEDEHEEKQEDKHDEDKDKQEDKHEDERKETQEDEGEHGD
jgi:hypothetical protein